MGRGGKIALGALLLIAAAIGIGLWTRNNLDHLVKQAIEEQGSAMTGVKVRVGAVRIAPGDGIGEISDLLIGNPAGFHTPHLLKVAQIRIHIDLASVLQPVIHLHEISVLAPDVIYEKSEQQTNIDALQTNIQRATGASGNTDGSKQPRLRLDLFQLRAATAHASAGFMQGKSASISLPDITLRDIGKDGGVTPAELGQIIAGAIKQKLSLAYNFDRALQATSKALDKAGEAIKGLFK
jgi:hypothetical protein